MAELLLPSTRTTLIQCSYYLEVRIIHKGMMMGNRLKPVSLPITIFVPNLPKSCSKIQIP